MEKFKKRIRYVSGSSYNLKIMLTHEFSDLGFFDTYENAQSTSIGTTDIGVTTTISGTSTNKLYAIRTYSQSDLYNLMYQTSTNISVNGLDLIQSSLGGAVKTYIYYVDNISYKTITSTGSTATTFSYVSIQGNPILFDNKPILKLETKLNQVENPTIDPDVFIVRQSLPVLEDNYRLSDIQNVDQLTKYGSGYFNIINNT